MNILEKIAAYFRASWIGSNGHSTRSWVWLPPILGGIKICIQLCGSERPSSHTGLQQCGRCGNRGKSERIMKVGVGALPLGNPGSNTASGSSFVLHKCWFQTRTDNNRTRCKRTRVHVRNIITKVTRLSCIGFLQNFGICICLVNVSSCLMIGCLLF